MNQTKRFGLLAALFFAVLAPACKSTVESGGTGGAGGSANNGGGGAGGCQDPAQCWLTCPGGVDLPPQGAPCAVEGERCGQLDECGYGAEAHCFHGSWDIVYYDPAGCTCGDTSCMDPEKCPDEPPVNGGVCENDYYECSYYDPVCGLGTGATCAYGEWLVNHVSVGCEPSCPDTLPVDGTPCEECCSSSTCAYLDASGCPVHITCQNGAWVSSPASCTPTSACAPLDMSQCNSAQGCRWMAFPKCIFDEGGFPQGCYPVDDCASDADCNGGTCTAVKARSCPGGECMGCSGEARLCVP